MAMKKDYKLIDLRPERSLLKPCFDGYKLSLSPVPILQDPHGEQLPHRIRLEEYSFLDQELYSYQNLLYSDPWNENSVYYITEQWEVQNISFLAETGKIIRSKKASFKLSNSEALSGKKYNTSLYFIGEEFALIANGLGSLFLVSTGKRKEKSDWNVVHKDDNLIESGGGFVIKHARLDEVDGRKELNAVLLQIVQEEGENSKFLSELTWIALTETANGTWEKNTTKTLSAKSPVSYCALTKNRKGVILAGRTSFKFKTEENEVLEEINSENTPSYSWTQTDEDVLVNFKTIPNAEKTDYTVQCSKEDLQVKFKSEILVHGKLTKPVDPDLTTWSFNNDFLQLNLVKAVEGQSWVNLIEGQEVAEDVGGDSSFLREPIETRNIANIGDRFEDCDQEENEYFVERHDGSSQKMTHRIFLGSNPPLLQKNLTENNQMPAIVLRHDVDACVWQPNDDGTSWRHEGTLDAFAYILSSKQQKKFVGCSPNFDYSVICEPERHVFIYKANYDTASGLRNRSGNQMKFGQQRLVTLDGTGEVLGMSVQREVTILLCESGIMCLKIFE